MTDFSLYGHNLFGEPNGQKKDGVLAAKYEFPPFSVLDARQGEWQERKRMWIGQGIKSELGRDGSPGGSPRPACDYSNKERGDGAGRPTGGLLKMSDSNAMYMDARKEYLAGNKDSIDAEVIKREHPETSGTSIFDPVLCELIYRWFCPAGGQVLDPFAGGSVRGIVAGLLGFKYWGCDLSEKQIAANQEQRESIAPDALIEWIVGDSLDEISNAPVADLVFSCPPYGDLERYSDHPRDLSTMEYHTFIAAYKRIILKCYSKMKPNAFACFVVGDFRDKKTGHYRGFVADTINAFRDVGLPLYNDAVLVTSVGSLPIRVDKQFSASRKLGKTHQNVLVFVKGDPRKIF